MGIFNKSFRALIPVDTKVQGTAAATGTNYGVFFIADRKYRVEKVREVHDVVGSDGGTVTVSVEKLTGTQAADSGVDLLSAALSLKATARTVQSGALTATTADLILAAGDRLCLKDAGTLTAVNDVAVTVYLRPLE